MLGISKANSKQHDNTVTPGIYTVPWTYLFGLLKAGQAIEILGVAPVHVLSSWLGI
jgi:hypothetical protein